MTRQEKEQAIIRNIKALPNTDFGSYKYMDGLRIAIANAMGYKVTYFSNNGSYLIEERDQVAEIIRRMEAKKIIRISKSGLMFKLN